MTKKTYKLTGLTCPACATLLESDLEDCGIKCSCSFAKSELEAEISDKSSEEITKEVIRKSGYKIGS